MGQKFKVSPGVYLIMQKDDKVLFMHRINTDYQKGMYMLPGGGIEAGEPPTIATVREAKEELDIDVDASSLTPAHFMYRPPHDDTGERADYFFVTSKWSGEPKINEPHKCDELRWLPLHDLPDSVPAYVRTALRHWLNSNIYSEFDWKT